MNPAEDNYSECTQAEAFHEMNRRLTEKDKGNYKASDLTVGRNSLTRILNKGIRRAQKKQIPIQFYNGRDLYSISIQDGNIFATSILDNNNSSAKKVFLGRTPEEVEKKLEFMLEYPFLDKYW